MTIALTRLDSSFSSTSESSSSGGIRVATPRCVCAFYVCRLSLISHRSVDWNEIQIERQNANAICGFTEKKASANIVNEFFLMRGEKLSTSVCLVWLLIPSNESLSRGCRDLQRLFMLKESQLKRYRFPLRRHIFIFSSCSNCIASCTNLCNLRTHIRKP